VLDPLLRSPARREAPLEDPGKARPFALLSGVALHVVEQLLLEVGLGLAKLRREADEERVALGRLLSLAAFEPVEERSSGDSQLGGHGLEALRGEDRRAHPRHELVGDEGRASHGQQGVKGETIGSERGSEMNAIAGRLSIDVKEAVNKLQITTNLDLRDMESSEIQRAISEAVDRIAVEAENKLKQQNVLLESDAVEALKDHIWERIWDAMQQAHQVWQARQKR
jgi:hypothetical protein